MLIALFTILFLGSSTTGFLDYLATTEDNIKVVMEKDDRRKAALATVKNMEKRTKARNKQVDKARKEVAASLASDDATVADIDAIWDVYFAAIDDYNKDIVDLRFELRDSITRDEWQQIFVEEQE